MTAPWQGRDAGQAIVRAVMADAAAHGVRARLLTCDQTPWASATFTGARHVLTLAAPGSGEATTAWASQLAEAELPLSHHVAADAIARIAPDGRIMIEILTVAKA